MSAWPDAVWRSPWLVGLDATGRATLEASGDLRALERGEALFAPGEPADGFFVVNEGVVEVMAVRRGDVQATTLRRAVAGDAVGEEAVVRSGFARMTGARCATRARVVRVPVGVYRRAARTRRRSDAGERMGAGPARRRGEGCAPAPRASRATWVRGISRGPPGSPVTASSREGIRSSRGGIRRGDVLVVADGMVSLETEEEGRARIQAYLGRGDLVGDGAEHAALER